MLGDDIAAALPGLRAEAESRMRETCLVRRPIGVEPDPMTGADVPVFAPDPVYTGKARVKAENTQARAGESAGSTVVAQSPAVHIPWASAALLPGDVVDFAADTYTPRLQGLTFRVTGVHVGSDLTAQRVPVEILPGVA